MRKERERGDEFLHSKTSIGLSISQYMKERPSVSREGAIQKIRGKRTKALGHAPKAFLFLMAAFRSCSWYVFELRGEEKSCFGDILDFAGAISFGNLGQQQTLRGD